MANQMNWPSEDEDFDAIVTATSARPAPVKASGPKPNFKQKSGSSHAVKISEPEPVDHNEDDYTGDDFMDDPRQPDEEATNFMPEAAARNEERSNDDNFESEEALPAEEEPANRPEAVMPARVKAPKPPKPPKAPKAPRQPGQNRGLFRNLLDIILLIMVVWFAWWAWNLRSDKQNLEKQVASFSNNPQVLVQKQTNDLIHAVGQLMQLPADETPTVANVTDATQAKQQSAFFKDAENGDKVLMYVKAGQAILYRPSTGKIVLVAPLTFTDDASTTKASTNTAGTTTTTSTTGSTTNKKQ